ncbi:hypothetical protein BDQ17DRAFT_1431666 [Cyathus striatus]|nr:hypothetical protein BDQ17DRAFT_1431666 [Cyathus striatus]
MCRSPREILSVEVRADNYSIEATSITEVEENAEKTSSGVKLVEITETEYIEETEIAVVGLDLDKSAKTLENTLYMLEQATYSASAMPELKEELSHTSQNLPNDCTQFKRPYQISGSLFRPSSIPTFPHFALDLAPTSTLKYEPPRITRGAAYKLKPRFTSTLFEFSTFDLELM